MYTSVWIGFGFESIRIGSFRVTFTSGRVRAWVGCNRVTGLIRFFNGRIGSHLSQDFGSISDWVIIGSVRIGSGRIRSGIFGLDRIFRIRSEFSGSKF